MVNVNKRGSNYKKIILFGNDFIITRGSVGEDSGEMWRMKLYIFVFDRFTAVTGERPGHHKTITGGVGLLSSKPPSGLVMEKRFQSD